MRGSHWGSVGVLCWMLMMSSGLRAEPPKFGSRLQGMACQDMLAGSAPAVKGSAPESFEKLPGQIYSLRLESKTELEELRARLRQGGPTPESTDTMAWMRSLGLGGRTSTEILLSGSATLKDLFQRWDSWGAETALATAAMWSSSGLEWRDGRNAFGSVHEYGIGRPAELAIGGFRVLESLAIVNREDLGPGRLELELRIAVQGNLSLLIKPGERRGIPDLEGL